MLFLTILKIIGFVLLGILAFLLLLICILLFWPIFYSVDGSYHDNLTAHARVHYFFHLIRAVFSYEDKKPLLEARVLWFTLYRRDFSEKEEEEADKTKDPEFEATSASDENYNEQAEAEIEDLADFDDLTDEEIEEYMQLEPPKRNFKEFVAKTIQKIKERWYNFEAKWKETKDKADLLLRRIKYYNRVLHHRSMAPAWEMIKKTIKGFFKAIKPYRMDVRIHFGADDPAATGKVVAVYSMAYPFIRKGIKLNAEFEQKIFEADGVIKGRIQIYKLVFIALRAFFNKHIRKMIRLFTREGKKNGRE